MGLPFIIVAGLAIGWLAAVIGRIEGFRGIAIQLVAGLAGALAAGLLIAPFLGAGNLLAGTYGIAAVLLTLVGATVVVALLNVLGPNFARGRAGPKA
ncbi:GlsB/YeaQ/YmgE family stress response membrane protein [Croceibacterium aestuarii]|uniref:GlsB/YeaQ/YmgE family stress response membrane protein n=1 Tax=Croceibacterium aestuarii TaxID=3064139 RepID=UPI00272E11C4|nr:GlsB/YeaQ/YmgE family stress response membrane protein [Croceibacterium sp. D39]